MRTHRILKALISAVNCNQIFPRLLIFRIYPKPRDFYQQFIFLWKHRRVRRLEKNSKLNCFAVFSLGHGCNQNLLPLISFCFIFQAKNVFLVVVAYFVYPWLTPSTAVSRYLSSLAAIHSLAMAFCGSPDPILQFGMHPQSPWVILIEDLGFVQGGRIRTSRSISASPKKERQDDLRQGTLAWGLRFSLDPAPFRKHL